MSKNLIQINKLDKNFPEEKSNSQLLSDIIIANNETKNIQNYSTDLFNTLSSFYIKKNKITTFFEKIYELNKQFISNNEKFILTKTSYEKLSDDLFKNLFKQIDCYVQEIQRLNKKIIVSNENKDEFKEIIKKLNKEILENKEKIRDYEIKMKENAKKEENLLKEVDYYKKRVIFFKNKININLISKNINSRNPDILLNKKKFGENKNNSNNNIFRNSNNNSNSCKYKKINNYLSPSPIKTIKKKNNLCSSNGASNNKIFDRKKPLNTKIYYSNLDNSNNENRNLITVNVEKFQKIFFGKEFENNSNKNIIEMKRNKSKENFNFPYNKNYFNIVKKNKNNETKKKEENIFLTKHEELFTKKYIEEHLDLYSKDKKNNLEISSNNRSYLKNLNSAIPFKRKRKIINNSKKENKSNILNEKNFSKFSSSKDLNILKINNTIFNKDYNNRHPKNKTAHIYDTNLNKKLQQKKLFNLNSHNYINIKTSYKTIDHNRCNTTIGNENKNISYFNKPKIGKLNQEEKPFIKKNTYIKPKQNNIINENENIIKKNNPAKTFHNIIKELLLNPENFKNSDNNLIDISNKIRKEDNKLNINKKSPENIRNKIKTSINVNKKINGKEINKDINKNDLINLFKEINEDYNNNIEMLTFQEEQIKYLLNLIDLNEEE